MTDHLYINGRFLAQPLSGVQRFAIEMTAALGRISAADGKPRPIVLTPSMPSGDQSASSSLATTLDVRAVGRHTGQVWEQLELATYAHDGVLINLGNTAPLRGRKQIVVIHDAGVFRSPDTYSWKFRAWYKLLQGLLTRGRARIVTVSEFSREEIVRHLGARRSDIDVISEGADHMIRLSADPTVLTRNGLRRGRFVMAVGNLAAHKNLPALRNTAQALAARGLDLVITGGLDRTVFAQRQNALPMPAKYIGRVSDEALRALYEAAACFVFPSLYEGFGLPAVEAMICGCPVVAADIPALREVCGAAALFCDPADPSDISAKICGLLDDVPMIERLQCSMRERVGQYTWESAASKLRAVATHV